MADILYQRKSKDYLAGYRSLALYADGSVLLDEEKHLLTKERLQHLLSFLAGNEEFIASFGKKKILCGEKGAEILLLGKKFIVPEIVLDNKESDYFVASANENDSAKWRAYAIFRQIEDMLFL